MALKYPLILEITIQDKFGNFKKVERKINNQAALESQIIKFKSTTKLSNIKWEIAVKVQSNVSNILTDLC